MGRSSLIEVGPQLSKRLPLASGSLSGWVEARSGPHVVRTLDRRHVASGDPDSWHVRIWSWWSGDPWCGAGSSGLWPSVADPELGHGPAQASGDSSQHEE